ncbi:MAG: helix-turn-helix transcriptional regulator [Hyphomonadaceae bacterium]|nr:helix-turn-helix transcriptional regulator [Hyphomonadaceae bacterium]
MRPDFTKLIARFQSTTEREELRRLFIGALESLGVAYCPALAIDRGSDGAPQAAVILQSLPLTFSFEQFSAVQPRATTMITSLIADGEPREMTPAEKSLGDEWRGSFLDFRLLEEQRWRFAVPVFREGLLCGVAFYFSEKRPENSAIEFLVTFTNVGYDQLAVSGLLPPPPPSPPPSPLTKRQREVLALCAEGKSDWEIAQLLQISPVTAHEHVETAKRKLGVRTRIQAVALATQQRWI